MCFWSTETFRPWSNTLNLSISSCPFTERCYHDWQRLCTILIGHARFSRVMSCTPKPWNIAHLPSKYTPNHLTSVSFPITKTQSHASKGDSALSSEERLAQCHAVRPSAITTPTSCVNFVHLPRIQTFWPEVIHIEHVPHNPIRALRCLSLLGAPIAHPFCSYQRFQFFLLGRNIVAENALLIFFVWLANPTPSVIPCAGHSHNAVR